jgi:hypothetical protein
VAAEFDELARRKDAMGWSVVMEYTVRLGVQHTHCEATTEVRRFAWLDEEFRQHISSPLRYQMRWCAVDGCDRISSEAVRKSIDAACPVG